MSHAVMRPLADCAGIAERLAAAAGAMIRTGCIHGLEPGAAGCRLESLLVPLFAAALAPAVPAPWPGPGAGPPGALEATASVGPVKVWAAASASTLRRRVRADRAATARAAGPALAGTSPAHGPPSEEEMILVRQLRARRQFLKSHGTPSRDRNGDATVCQLLAKLASLHSREDVSCLGPTTPGSSGVDLPVDPATAAGAVASASCDASVVGDSSVSRVASEDDVGDEADQQVGLDDLCERWHIGEVDQASQTDPVPTAVDGHTGPHPLGESLFAPMMVRVPGWPKNPSDMLVVQRAMILAAEAAAVDFFSPVAIDAVVPEYGLNLDAEAGNVSEPEVTAERASGPLPARHDPEAGHGLLGGGTAAPGVDPPCAVVLGDAVACAVGDQHLHGDAPCAVADSATGIYPLVEAVVSCGSADVPDVTCINGTVTACVGHAAWESLPERAGVPVPARQCPVADCHHCLGAARALGRLHVAQRHVVAAWQIQRVADLEANILALRTEVVATANGG
jgi:hypothetical protein